MAEADADLTATPGQITGEGTDLLTSIEQVQLIGGSMPNKLDARTFNGAVELQGMGGNDTLLGSAFNDTLNGGTDSDSLVGGAGNDLMVKENLPATNYVLTNNALTRTRSVLIIDRLDSIELASLSINAPSPSVGYELNASQFTLGPVTLVGGAGSDTLFGSSRGDLLDGAGGNDWVVAKGNTNFSLTDTLMTGRGQDRLVSIEVAKITGGADANWIDATRFSGTTFLYGMEGDDTIYGGFGKDTIDGGDGHDVVKGGGGNDNLRGGSGNDSVNGNDGNDTLFDDLGTDLYEGETGDDVLAEYAYFTSVDTDTFIGGPGRDSVAYHDIVEGFPITMVITDSQISVRGAVVNLAQVDVVKVPSLYGTLDASAATSVSISANGSAFNDTLIGGGGKDTLSGMGGDDSLGGGEGNDYLAGGDGLDTVDSGVGIDTVLAHESGE